MSLRDRLTEKVGKGHLSYSSIKYALGDMRLWEMKMRGQIKYTSDALVFGTLYDMLLFERDKAVSEYQVIDADEILAGCSQKTQDSKSPHLTNEYKSIKGGMETDAESKGKTLVSASDWKKANEMIERLDACGLTDSYLKGKYQVEFNEEIDGVPVKGFLDCLGDGFITDSKSARSVDKFRYDVNSWSYDIQAYIYTKVFNIKDYYWVVQEKAFPFYPALVKCSDETLFRGEMKFHQALENIEKWLKDGTQTQTHYAEFTV
tara:strand:+ start:1084 stop:1866 length:783 start_codon:yes stop_codon:yes gene_type:complete